MSHTDNHRAPPPNGHISNVVEWEGSMMKTADRHKFDHPDVNKSSDELLLTSCATAYCCQRGCQFPDCHGLASKEFLIKKKGFYTQHQPLSRRFEKQKTSQSTSVLIEWFETLFLAQLWREHHSIHCQSRKNRVKKVSRLHDRTKIYRYRDINMRRIRIAENRLNCSIQCTVCSWFRGENIFGKSFGSLLPPQKT